MVVEVKSANILGHREYTASSTDGLRTSSSRAHSVELRCDRVRETPALVTHADRQSHSHLELLIGCANARDFKSDELARGVSVECPKFKFIFTSR
jgi:hypothetical protein